MTLEHACSGVKVPTALLKLEKQIPGIICIASLRHHLFMEGRECISDVTNETFISIYCVRQILNIQSATADGDSIDHNTQPWLLRLRYYCEALCPAPHRIAARTRLQVLAPSQMPANEAYAYAHS